MSDTVTIPKELFEELVSEFFYMQALVSSGVDNWEWYSEALDMYDPDEVSKFIEQYTK